MTTTNSTRTLKTLEEFKAAERSWIIAKLAKISNGDEPDTMQQGYEAGDRPRRLSECLRRTLETL